MDMSSAVAASEARFGLTNVQTLAHGGQKTVCTADMSGTPVVLKVVLLTSATDPHALERCEREVALLRDTSSPNLVAVLSQLHLLGSGPDAAVWLEEYLDGDDLSRLVTTPWTWSEAASFLADVGSGLAAMHRHGYIHRDLSAGNVRRQASGVWKVMDPGFAKHLNRTSITGLFQPGTAGFLSPEHAVMGGRVTPASDVFCLGILAFLGLVGRLPVPVGADMNDYRRRLLSMTPTALRTSRPDLSHGAAAVIDRCLLPQPARRYLDAAEVVGAVKALTAQGAP